MAKLIKGTKVASEKAVEEYKMSEAFKAIGRMILRNRGTLYESDIFSILKHSPFVVRSFEFGLADGALDCTRQYDTPMTYAEWFWDAYDRRLPGAQNPLQASSSCLKQKAALGSKLDSRCT